MIGRPNHFFGRKIAKGPQHDSQRRLHVRLLFPVDMNRMEMHSHQPIQLTFEKNNNIELKIEQVMK
jgi:hypothetical protein